MAGLFAAINVCPATIRNSIISQACLRRAAPKRHQRALIAAHRAQEPQASSGLRSLTTEMASHRAQGYENGTEKAGAGHLYTSLNAIK